MRLIGKLADKNILKKVSIGLLLLAFAASVGFSFLLYSRNIRTAEFSPEAYSLYSLDSSPILYQLESTYADHWLSPAATWEGRSENEFYWQVRQVKPTYDYLVINGWAYLPGEAITNATASLVLKEEDSGRFIKLRTHTFQLADTSQLQDDSGLDNSWAGIYTTCKRSVLQQGYTYTVYILYTNNGHAILSETDLQLGGDL